MKTNCKSRSRSETLPILYGSVTGTAKWGDLDFGTFKTYEGSKTMDDVVCRNYSKRIAQGEIINNPCRFVSTTLDELSGGSIAGTKPAGCPSGSLDSWYEYSGPITSYWLNYYGHNIDSYFDNYYTFPDDGSSDARREAILNCLADVDSTPYQFGEDLGEIRETIKFLKNPVTSLVQVGKAFRRAYKANLKKVGRGKAFASVFEAWLDAWLQYRFALRPLLMSGRDLVESIAKQPIVLPPRQTANGWGNSSNEGSPQTHNSGTSTATRVFTLEYNRESSYHATALYQVSNPINNWRRNAGLRLKDIPYTMWQLMPYSFVVDRAIDISSSIAGLTNLLDPSVRILAGSVTRRDEVTKTLSFTEKTDPCWTQTVSPSPLVGKVFTYHRALWSPGVADVIPPVNLKGLVDDVSKIVDDVALFVQLISR